MKREPSEANESIFSANDFGPDVRLTPRSKTPSTGTKCLVQNASVFNLRKVDEAISRPVSDNFNSTVLTRTGLDFNVHGLDWCLQDVGYFLLKRFRRQAMVTLRPVRSAVESAVGNLCVLELGQSISIAVCWWTGFKLVRPIDDFAAHADLL